MDTICRQYKKAIASLPDYKADCVKLLEAAGVANVKKWSKEANCAGRGQQKLMQWISLWQRTKSVCYLDYSMIAG